jgi:hypothetical protein
MFPFLIIHYSKKLLDDPEFPGIFSHTKDNIDLLYKWNCRIFKA